MKFDIVTSSQYERDVRLAKRRGLDIESLLEVVRKLAEGIRLPEKNKDHALTGNYNGLRECHIKPDWILLYKKDVTVKLLSLVRTGTHSDIFGK